MILRLLALTFSLILGLSGAFSCGILLFVDSPGIDPDPVWLVLGLLAGAGIGGGSLWAILRENRRWVLDFRDSFDLDPGANLACWRIPAAMWKDFTESERLRAEEERSWVSSMLGLLIGAIVAFVGWQAWGATTALLVGLAAGLASAGAVFLLEWRNSEHLLRHEAKWCGPEVTLRPDGMRIGATVVPWSHYGAHLESIALRDEDEGNNDYAVLEVAVEIQAQNTVTHTHRVPVPREHREKVASAVSHLASGTG